jgi:hypothetical protein
MASILRRWGKPGKAGKSTGPATVNGNPSGPSTGGNEIAAAPFRYGVQPVPLRMAHALFVATSLTSPMVAGRFRPQDKGDANRRGTTFGSPDLGPLQSYAGSYAGPQTVRLGAQAGPSQQPAFPNTNNDSAVDLSGLGLPDVWRVNRL